MQHVVLLHYWADQLCMWRPEDGHALARRTVYVYGDWKMLNHFGSHWLDNVPPLSLHPLWKVMLRNPDMANPQKRDASALRLLSWLSFSLDRQTSALLAKHEAAHHGGREQSVHSPNSSFCDQLPQTALVKFHHVMTHSWAPFLKGFCCPK